MIAVGLMLFHAVVRSKYSKLKARQDSNEQHVESHMLVMELGDVIDQGRNPAIDLYTVGREKQRILQDMYIHYKSCGVEYEQKESEELSKVKE